MKALLKGGRVFRGGLFRPEDILVQDGIVVSIQPDLPADAGDLVFFLHGRHVLPGLADVHVHLREPGGAYKETIRTGTQAAAQGGFTLVCAMPNLNPPPDTPAHLEEELALIRAGAVVPTLPYGCITLGRQGRALCDFASMAPQVAGFSDDGSGVQDEATMRAAMQAAKAADVLLCAHCEDESLLHGGVIHSGGYARAHGLPGISSESEWRQIERDIRLVAETGARYHVCHVSTKESVQLIRHAKAQGLPVSCETAPHYLCFNDADLQDDGRFRMNPPIRSREDQQALIAGVVDGTIEVIATDHAPHSAEEKAGGLANSLMGVVGLETALAACYTKLVLGGHLSLETLIDRMSSAPRRLVRREIEAICPGRPLDATVVDFEQQYTVDPTAFASKGRSTPFEGARLHGQVQMTWAEGKLVWQKEES